MEQNIFQLIPRRSLIYILTCLVGVMVYFFLSILPTQNYLNSQDMEIENLRGQLEVSKRLLPLYQILMTRVTTEKRMALPFPEERGISRKNMGDIQDIFSGLARKNNLQVQHILPDFQTMPKGAGSLAVDVSLAGTFNDLRGFLGGLGGTPALRHIEEIEVSAGQGAKTFRFKCWVAIGK